MKHFLTLAVGALLSLSSAISADINQKTTNSVQNYNITPEASPQVTHGIDAFITADFIYWTSRMDGVAYAAGNRSDGTHSVSKGQVYHPDWDWDPGFKVGLGLNLPYDGWDLYVNYTSLNSNSSDSVDKINLMPTWNISDTLNSAIAKDYLQSASVNWQSRFNVIDVELGRNFYISKALALRPFIGFKGTWQEQDYRLRYNALVEPKEGTRELTILKMKNDQDSWGVGLRTGLNTSWNFVKHFSFYGDLALSGVWMGYDVERRDSRRPASSNTATTQVYIEDNHHSIEGVLEFGIGLRGQWYFFEERYSFLLQAGWEEQIWINHNRLVRLFVNESANGDFVLQGLTLKARFDF